MIASFIEWLLLNSVRLLAGGQARCIGTALSGRQSIYVANHASHLDFLLISAALPPSFRRTRPVAAADYWTSNPLRRYIIQNVFRCVLLGRGSFQLNPLEPVARALRDGDSLIFFPEGTRGPGETLQPLKPGIFYIARWFPRIDIVPVWIDNSYRILPKGFAIPVPLICSLAFGPPLRVQPGQQQEEFLTELRGALEALRSA